MGSAPRHRTTLLVGGHTIAVTHIQNRGRLAQMLAQGESSSHTHTHKKQFNTELIVFPPVLLIYTEILYTHLELLRKYNVTERLL